MGKCLGIVGFGGIGRAVAKRARALGMTIVAHDRYLSADSDAWAEYAVACQDLVGLLEMSDVVSLHVPLTDQTRHIIDDAMLKKMKPGAMIARKAAVPTANITLFQSARIDVGELNSVTKCLNDRLLSTNPFQE